ncbi:MAG: site-2 protease family protein [Clostridia bacterium]|nr:site-2 protease family protein [Clostridia bacterium]
MYIDRRMIYIVMAIMLISGLASYLSDVNNLLGLLLSIPGILIAITFHEFAHAFAADKLGDDTPRNQGRLTLNPLGHLDPIGTIMLLFARVGWGKPVEVNPRNYDRRFSMDKADSIVSIAGPLMNFLLAIVLTLIYCLIYKVASITFLNSQIGTIIMLMLNIAISINVGLGVFNLIPLPPLDGSKVIKPFLPFNAREWFEKNEKLFEMIFVALWIFGILGKIISPVISIITEGILKLGFTIFGI